MIFENTRGKPFKTNNKEEKDFQCYVGSHPDFFSNPN